MRAVIKKIGDLSQNEILNLQTFYHWNCDEPYLLQSPYQQKESICVILKKGSLGKGTILASLRFYEDKQSRQEAKEFGKAKLIKISGLQVDKSVKGKGVGKRAIEDFIAFLKITETPPVLLRIEPSILPRSASDLGFEQFGRSFFYYKMLVSEL